MSFWRVVEAASEILFGFFYISFITDGFRNEKLIGIILLADYF